MENGARPAAAGAHWLAAVPPNFRARVIGNIMKNSAHAVPGDQLHLCASRYEVKVLSHSDNAEDYLRKISKQMMCLQLRWAAASELQQQAQMGRHQMRPADAVVANSSADTMPTSAILTTSELTSTQQPQERMNQQDLRLDQRQGYQTQNGQHTNVVVATMQTGQCGGQQLGSPDPAAGGVDWREDMFQKITSLKDAHSSELAEFARALQASLLRIEANGGQLQSLPEHQARQFRQLRQIMEKIQGVMSFLQIQKTSIPESESAKDQLDTCQTTIHDLLRSYRASKASNAAKKNTARQCRSQNCPEPPHNHSQQNHHHEQPAAEALSHSSQNVPSGTPLAQQQNHGDQFAEADHFAGEAEDNSVRSEAESPVAVNLPCDTAAFTGRTCSEEMQQMHPADEAIPQSTESVEPAGTSLGHEQQTQSADSVRVEAEDDDDARAQAETPVSREALIKRGVDAARSLSPAALRSLASDMGVNLKRALHRRRFAAWPVQFDDESSERRCYKRQKTHDGTLLDDEIRAACNKLVETEIRISEDDLTGGAGGIMIELSYNAVSLAPDLNAAICPSAVSTKLLVPADYPQSSPVILGDVEQRQGVQRVVDLAFRRGVGLGLLPEPRSIEGMAKAWDEVVRRAILRFAHQLGGGTFSTRYGQWQSCVPV